MRRYMTEIREERGTGAEGSGVGSGCNVGPSHGARQPASSSTSGMQHRKMLYTVFVLCNAPVHTYSILYWLGTWDQSI